MTRVHILDYQLADKPYLAYIEKEYAATPHITTSNNTYNCKSPSLNATQWTFSSRLVINFVILISLQHGVSEWVILLKSYFSWLIIW